MENHAAPPVVPATFWDHPPLRRALERRHLGQLIRAYRHHPFHGRTPLTQGIVGTWLGITQTQLSRVENGPAVVHLDRLEAWTRALGVPGRLLWFHRDDRVEQDRRHTTTPDQAGAVVASTDLEEEQMEQQRRMLLGGIAAFAVSSGLLGPLGLLDSPVSGGTRIGRADVARLEAVTTLYRAADYERGGAALSDEIARFAEWASTLLDASCMENVRVQALSAVADVRQLAGWVAFDAGRYQESERHWRLAERLAVAADDQRMLARIRYCRARQFQQLGDDRTALELLRTARAQGASALTPGITAMLSGVEAASVAALDDRQEAVRVLGRAQDLLAQFDPSREPHWMRFFGRGEALAEGARVYRDLARADRRHGAAAVRWATDAIEALGPQSIRSSVLNQVGLCTALFLAGEPEAAIQAGQRAIENAHGLRSARVAYRIRNLHRDLGRYEREPDVADFRRAIAAVGNAPPLQA